MNLVLPGVTGIYYAILNDCKDVIKELLPQEFNCLTKEDIVVPTT